MIAKGMITEQLGNSRSINANETVCGRSNLLPLAMKVDWYPEKTLRGSGSEEKCNRKHNLPPMEGGKEGLKKKPKVIKWLFITYLTLNFDILILITSVILTKIAKITDLMVINKKEIAAQHWFGHMAFLPFGQNSLENLKTLQVFTQIWGQSRNLLLCGRLWL